MCNYDIIWEGSLIKSGFSDSFTRVTDRLKRFVASSTLETANENESFFIIETVSIFLTVNVSRGTFAHSILKLN